MSGKDPWLNKELQKEVVAGTDAAAGHAAKADFGTGCQPHRDHLVMAEIFHTLYLRGDVTVVRHRDLLGPDHDSHSAGKVTGWSGAQVE